MLAIASTWLLLRPRAGVGNSLSVQWRHSKVEAKNSGRPATVPSCCLFSAQLVITVTVVMKGY